LVFNRLKKENREKRKRKIKPLGKMNYSRKELKKKIFVSSNKKLKKDRKHEKRLPR